MTAGPKLSGVMRKAFGWGGSMAAVRLVCSFISIKITAVYLGPPGLALVAQFANFVGLFQSMLGQGLVTGLSRLSPEYRADPPRRRALYATVLQMGIAMVLVLGLILAAASPFISQWLLTDRQYTLVIAISGIAVAAGILTNVLQAALGVTKEIGLIGGTTIVSTVLGLAIFAPFTYLWGIDGGLYGTFLVMIVSAIVTAITLHRKSSGVRLSEFIGRFDQAECMRLLNFYPMLIVNGVFPPLVLILIRDTLTSTLSLEMAGLWQATWRLSEAYLAIIVSSVSLYFMPSMGERSGEPVRLRHQVLRSLMAATLVTGLIGAAIFLFREQIVHVVFSERFSRVSSYIPLQLLGDVLKMGGWILSMTLVAMVRTGWFISITILAAAIFIGLAQIMIPTIGIFGVLWAYVLAGVVHLLVAAFALRDILFLHTDSAQSKRQ